MAVPNSYAFMGGQKIMNQTVPVQSRVQKPTYTKKGVVTRTSKTGFQLDNVSIWFNPDLYKYHGPSMTEIRDGQEVEFTYIVNQTTKGSFNNVTQLSFTGPVPESNGPSQNPTTSPVKESTTNQQVVRNVIAYAVFQSPVVAQLVSKEEGWRNSLAVLSNLARAVEQYVQEGQKPLHECIDILRNGVGKEEGILEVVGNGSEQ